MAAMQGIGEASESRVALNLTAMVDVILCLCLFFMCTWRTKQLEGKIQIWLPKEYKLRCCESMRIEIRVILRSDETTHRLCAG